MPHDDGTLTRGEMRDIDQNRRILAERATDDLLTAIMNLTLTPTETNVKQALALAYNRGQDEQRSREG